MDQLNAKQLSKQPSFVTETESKEKHRTFDVKVFGTQLLLYKVQSASDARHSSFLLCKDTMVILYTLRTVNEIPDIGFQMKIPH